MLVKTAKEIILSMDCFSFGKFNKMQVYEDIKAIIQNTNKLEDFYFETKTKMYECNDDFETIHFWYQPYGADWACEFNVGYYGQSWITGIENEKQLIEFYIDFLNSY